MSAIKNIRSHSASRKKIYLFSLSITLILVVFLGGMMIADYRCRSAAFGDTAMPLSVERLDNGKAMLNIHTMGIDSQLDVTAGAKAWEAFCEFICLPVK